VDEAQAILTDAAIAHEADTAARLGAQAEEELAALEAAGMTTIELEGDARANYLAAARQTTWDRMKSLMEESPQGAGNYDRLIELFYNPALD